MKRFNAISLYGSDFTNYELPKYEQGEFIVDDSNFIPMSEAIKSLSKTLPLAQGTVEAVYDFPDGVDDGRKVDVARMRPEIVELSVETRKANKKLGKALAEAEQRARDTENINSFTKKE